LGRRKTHAEDSHAGGEDNRKDALGERSIAGNLIPAAPQ
jgi:hypothetical protein